MKAVTVVVHGNVQGVGYRYSARSWARQMGVSGWVRNLYDGSVEVLAQGEEAAIAELLAVLREGPSGASVAEVIVTDVELDPTLRGFEVRG
jgi:acylphosphatase